MPLVCKIVPRGAASNSGSEGPNITTNVTINCSIERRIVPPLIGYFSGRLAVEISSRGSMRFMTTWVPASAHRHAARGGSFVAPSLEHTDR